MSTTTSSAGNWQRVAVVGVTGSGKTTLAKTVAQRLGLAHVELDALYWGPNWTPAPPEVFRARAAEALAGAAWVTDGNYSTLRDLIWPRAEALIWLDYSLALIWWRLARRTCQRVMQRTVLWNGNRDRLWHQLGRDSLFLWALETHPRHRRDYPALLALPEHAHLQVARLPSPRAAAEWLAGVPATA
jgi:adenylate kinase family enzyme